MIRQVSWIFGHSGLLGPNLLSVMEEPGGDSGNESPEADRMTWTSLDEYHPRDPMSLVPALTTPQAASASTSSGDGVRASSGSKSSGYLRRAGRDSGPGSHDPDTDSHQPVTVHDPDPGPSGAAGGVPMQNPPKDSLAIIEVACHPQTGNMFVLFNTATGLTVSRIRKSDLDCIDVSFSVSHNTNQENHEPHLSQSDNRQDEGRKGGITVVCDYIVVRTKQSLALYNLDGLRLRVVEVEELLDASGFDQTVYCLLEGGRLSQYSIPDLDPATMITVHDMEQASRIATCPETGRVAILNPVHHTVNVYDSHMDFIRSIVLPEPCENICLNGDELLLGLCEKKGDCCYVDYTLATAAWVVLSHPHTTRYHKWLGRIGSEWHHIRFCVMDEDHLLGNFGNHVGQLDLYDIRRRGVACTRTNTGISVTHNLPKVLVSTHNRWYAGNEHSIYCISLDKITDELLVVSKSGLIRVYSRDLTRPVAQYELPGFLGQRLDTTDEGEAVAIQHGQPGGQLNIFSPDRQLRSSIDIEQTPLDVVCSEDKIYVLLDDSVIVYRTTDRREEEIRRLPLGMKDDDPRCTRLAVRGDILYLLIPGRNRVMRMDLGDPAPTLTPFIQNQYGGENLDKGLGSLAVTELGNVVISVWESPSSQGYGTDYGLRIFSPAGKLINHVTTDISAHHIAPCPGRGAFIASNYGEIRYIDSIVNTD